MFCMTLVTFLEQVCSRIVFDSVKVLLIFLTSRHSRSLVVIISRRVMSRWSDWIMSIKVEVITWLSRDWTPRRLKCVHQKGYIKTLTTSRDKKSSDATTRHEKFLCLTIDDKDSSTWFSQQISPKIPETHLLKATQRFIRIFLRQLVTKHKFFHW